MATTTIKPESAERTPAAAGATRAGVGYSENASSRQAGAEAARDALARAGVEACDVALMFTTSKHDPRAFHEGVRSVLGAGPRLIGGYSVGLITNHYLGYEGYQAGVAVLASGRMKADMFVATGLDRGEHEVGRALGEQIRAATFEGEPNLLLMYDSIKGVASEGLIVNMATPMLDGLFSALGAWPRTAGVGMIGDMQWNKTYQWFDDRIEQQAAMALVLHGGVRMDTVIMHGCKPSGAYHTITKTDGPAILEIDGKPALEAVAGMLGPYSDRSWEEYPLFVTLGVNKGDKFGEFREEDYSNHLCMAVDQERGALVMFEPNLTPGTEVQLMRRSIDFDYVTTRTRELFARLEGRRPFFALYIDCAGRASVYCNTDGEEAEMVQQAIGDVPLLGMYSGVEIAEVAGQPDSLDWTGVLCLFSE